MIPATGAGELCVCWAVGAAVGATVGIVFRTWDNHGRYLVGSRRTADELGILWLDALD